MLVKYEYLSNENHKILFEMIQRSRLDPWTPCMGKLTGWTTKNLTKPIIGILMQRQTHIGLSNWEYKEALFECSQENKVTSGVLDHGESHGVGSN